MYDVNIAWFTCPGGYDEIQKVSTGTTIKLKGTLKGPLNNRLLPGRSNLLPESTHIIFIFSLNKSI
jgi:hypothetical protein